MFLRTISFKNWLIAALAVVGAFFLSGIGGYLLARLFGYWEIPVAGFTAAFTVVFVSYLSAPSVRLTIATVTFSIGSIIAWYLLVPSEYPESYRELAYQATHIPIAVTISGGILAMAICLFRRRVQNGK